jgi:hypothetical protein
VAALSGGDVVGGAVSDAVLGPEHAYEWRAPADRDADVLGVLACAGLGDHEGAVSILASLDDEQTVSLVWCLSCWLAGELGQQLEDPVSELRRLALLIGHRRTA